MKITKLLKTSMLISLLLFFIVNPAYNQNIKNRSYERFKENQYNALIKACEADYLDVGTAALVECITIEFYGLNQIIHYLKTLPQESEDLKVLLELLETYQLPEFGTFDYTCVHILFERYLEDGQI